MVLLDEHIWCNGEVLDKHVDNVGGGWLENYQVVLQHCVDDSYTLRTKGTSMVLHKCRKFEPELLQFKPG